MAEIDRDARRLRGDPPRRPPWSSPASPPSSSPAVELPRVASVELPRVASVEFTLVSAAELPSGRCWSARTGAEVLLPHKDEAAVLERAAGRP